MPPGLTVVDGFDVARFDRERALRSVTLGVRHKVVVPDAQDRAGARQVEAVAGALERIFDWL